MTTTAPRYTGTAIALHWLLAVLIIGNFTLGLVMVDIPGVSLTKLKLINWHKWAGVTIFGVVTLRLLWRLRHPAPPLPASMPRWQAVAAEGMHYLLYALMFAIPLSGYFYSMAAGYPVVYFGKFPLPVLIGKNKELAGLLKDVHYVLNTGLCVLVIAHFGAALKHHFFDRDGVLQRMLPRFSQGARP